MFEILFKKWICYLFLHFFIDRNKKPKIQDFVSRRSINGVKLNKQTNKQQQRIRKNLILFLIYIYT